MRRCLVLIALIGCNQPPGSLEVRITPEGATTSDTLVAEIVSEAADPDGDGITYRYRWSRDGADVDGSEATIDASETSRDEVWTVSVEPFDGTDVGPVATAEITIANAVPTAAVDLFPEAPSTEDDLVATLATEDADGGFVDGRIVWTRDGITQDIREPRVDSDLTRKGEVWEIVVTPEDDRTDGEPASASVIVGNSAPSVRAAAIEPARLDRRTTASCVATGWEDADGDAEDARVSWSVDGTEVSVEASLDLAPYERGSQVQCTLTPFDGEDEGEPVSSRAVEIGNTAPSLASVTIGPEDPTTGTTIEATLGELLDVDGDTITLAWSWRVDGVQRASGEVLPGNRYLRDQEIQLLLTPSDASGAGEPVASNVLVAANTLPVVTSITLSPASPQTDDLVVATVEADDADGDPVTLTYSWVVDGSSVSTTGDTLDGATDFDKDDSISVTVTPSDTDAGVGVKSDTIYAINTPPPAPAIGFSPEEPGADDDVTCVIEAQDADADADTITYTFAWTVDGSPYTSATTTTYTGDTIPSTARTEEDRWTCTVTPHDGDDNGVDVSRTLGEEPTDITPTGTVSNTAFRRGSMTGTAYVEPCDTGEFLVGISGDLTSSSGYFAELATRCAPLTVSSCDSTSCTVGTGTVTTGTYRGGSGSYLATEDCPSGSVVTGFVGRSGWYLDQLTIRCAPVEVSHDGTDWSVSLGSASDRSPMGGSGGGAFSRADCSTGEVASGATIGARSGEVEGFRLACQELDLTVE